MSENTVTMSLASYNQIKAENTRWQMFMSRMWEGCELRSDYQGLEFDAAMIAELMHIMYPDSYKKKLSYLRGQQTKLSMKKLELEGTQDTKEGHNAVSDNQGEG